jgi:hypothetical protein
MEAKRFHRLLGCACALYFIGSAAVAQAQDAELPFVPVLTIGSTALVNDGVTANADGSFTVLGNQQGGTVNGQPVWDLTWNLTLNQDPSIAGAVTLTNLTTTTRSFNLAFALPVTPAFSPSLFGGSITATLVDASGDLSATLAPIAVSPSIYRGTIDGSTALSLLAANVSCFGSSAGCTAIGMDDFGLPGPTLPGPAVNSAIGIFLNFSLSPGDRVTFNTSFIVEPPAPVPLPAALPLLLMGLGSLALKRRVLKHSTGR